MPVTWRCASIAMESMHTHGHVVKNEAEAEDMVLEVSLEVSLCMRNTSREARVMNTSLRETQNTLA